MKIVYLLPGGLFNSGGMERVVTIKANYLTDVFNYDVSIVTTEQMGRPVFYPLSDKIHLYHLDLDIGKYFGKENYIQKLFRRFFKIREYKKKISELLKEIQPDITITTLGGWDIDFINNLKDGSIKIGELHFPGNYRKLMARKLYKSYVPNLVGSMMSSNFKQECEKLTRLVVLTQEEKAYWKNPSNIEVIPNPLPFEPQHFSTAKNEKAIAVGRLAYEKGFDLLIKAWGKVAVSHPDWELTIYGSGSEKDTLLKLIKGKKLGNAVKLHDPVKGIQNIYPEYSMFILPSRYLEALPMVLLEAMACGVPLVAFDAPCGPKDVIKDGQNGFLVKAGDIKTLADKINQLIESPELRETMGKTAVEMSADYRIERIMPRWDQLFKELIHEKNSNIGN